MREFVIKALRNYGYRFLGNQSGCYTFGKPLGYGILRADVHKDANSVDVILIIKGNEKKGKRPNLIWTSASQSFLEENDKQKMYETFVQIVADCEADIFSKTPVAFPQNRGIRYDFEGNICIE